jgi:hypothetical protein
MTIQLQKRAAAYRSLDKSGIKKAKRILPSWTAFYAFVYFRATYKLLNFL